MFKAEVKASEATSPYNTYDSVLEKPNGNDPNQNAWLTLQLRIRLNFVDSKNPLTGLTVTQGGQTFARDHNKYLFPLADWPAHLIARFQRDFVKVAEKTWNWQFILITPKNYAELDFQSFGGSGWVVRPNVLCLFRLAVHGPAGPIDSSPAAGPMRSGPPHRTINVVNLSLSTTQVKLDTGVTPTAANPAIKNVKMDGLAWRSNASNYDDSDLFKPGMWNPEHKIISNTIGHEVGHALGQCHIMGLKGNSLYAFGGAKSDDKEAYGVGSTDPLDSWNIMGGGDRVYLVNAVSWKERIALHTGIAASNWQVTGMMNTPTRKMPLGVMAVGAPSEW